MVSLTLVAMSAYLFTHVVQSYCVYNRFNDDLAFRIHQVHSGAPAKKAFYQHIRPSFHSCCPYTEKDCSYNQVNNEEAKFSLTFDRAIEGHHRTISPRCTTGGALIIGGTVDNYYAECIDVPGTVFNALL